MKTVDDLPQARPGTIEHGEERLQRVELSICDAAGEEREVHVYEGYWAPLAEGQITLRDLIRFLLEAGGNGIRNGSKRFQRWIFGKFRDFEATGRTVRYLLVAAAVVLSLMVLNFAIVTLAALFSPLVRKPDWLTDALFSDISTTFNFVLTGLLALASVAAGHGLQRIAASRRKRRFVARVGWVGVWMAIIAIVLGGVAVPLLFALHVQNGPAVERFFWEEWLGRDLVVRFNAGLETALLIAVAATLVAVLVFLGKAVLPSGLRPAGEKAADTRSRGGLLVGLAIAGAALLALGWIFSGPLVGLWSDAPLKILRQGISWPLIVLVSARIRTLLVQYPGDVAVYVSPHILDRFNELRTEIRDCVHRQAEAVYAHTENGRRVYDRIYVVGHSLGAVVAYDALNRLIVQDEMVKRRRAKGGDAKAWQSCLHVLDRTGLLLTFGTPLDKTAFLFALQGNQTSETREALAAEVQPMIQHPGFRRFPWINIWSPEDIISGSLEFYDPPHVKPLTDRQKVEDWINGHQGFPAKVRGADLRRDPYMRETQEIDVMTWFFSCHGF